MEKRETLPEFSSYEEAAEWLDTHSTAHLKTTPVDFELSPQFTVRTISDLDEGETLVTIDQALKKQIFLIAKKEGIAAENLIKRWLKEKVDENRNLASA